VIAFVSVFGLQSRVRRRSVAFNDLIRGLKETEQQLVKQLESIRGAISSLEMGNSVSPAMRGRPVVKMGRPGIRKRRRLSAKARAAISRAQKLRWAKQRAQQKWREPRGAPCAASRWDQCFPVRAATASLARALIPADRRGNWIAPARRQVQCFLANSLQIQSECCGWEPFVL